MGKGVAIGLRNLVYCKLLTDPEEGAGKATYDAVKRIPGAITANVNPNASTDTLFADDGPYETAATVGQIALELNVADLPLEAQAELFGHTIDSRGILIRKAGDVPPWVAVGFKSLKSNGKYRYTWLAKGKFSLPEQNNETKGDSINWNTPTATGSFVKRECDDEWERHADEDTEAFTPEVAAQWFTNPYAEAAEGGA
jgi:phi13 family phage major tail protein